MFRWEGTHSRADDLPAPELKARHQGFSVVRTAVRLSHLPEDEEAMPSFDQTPDAPKPFGFKVSWFAVQATDPASVLDALEFGEATPANWASGIAAAYWDGPSNDRWVFVSPAVGGWVLVVGSYLPY